MTKDKLKGGKADNMSAQDLAKLHGVSIKEIEKEIEVGIKIEKEHTPDIELRREIAKDHILEDPTYYTNQSNGLIKKEKEADKRMEKLNEEAKKMMSLAGIKEMDIPNKKEDLNFTIFEIEQTDVEPGDDDEKLYKIK